MSSSRILLSTLFSCVLLLSLALPCWSHATLLTPTARTGQAVGNGIKVTPLPIPAGVACGGAAAADPGAGAIQATYTAGDTILVQWNIGIDHPSAPGVSIAVQYSAADTFANNQLITGVDVHNQLSGTVAGVSVTLPAGKSSNAAVLQWIWASASDGGYYIGCSDIKILAAAAPAASSTGGSAASSTGGSGPVGSTGSGGSSSTGGSGLPPGSTGGQKSSAFAIRYSVGVLAMLLAAVIAAFLYV